MCIQKITTKANRLIETGCVLLPFVVSATLLSCLGDEWEMTVPRFGKELPSPSEFFADYLNHPFTPFAVSALILVLPLSLRARASLWVSYFLGVILCMIQPFFWLGNIVYDENAPEPPANRLVWIIVSAALLISVFRLWKWARNRKKTSSDA